MPLVALKELRYAGRTILTGETFEAVSPQDARTLIAVGRAKQAEAKKEPVKEPELAKEDNEIAVPKRKYQTRHMKAEDE